MLRAIATFIATALACATLPAAAQTSAPRAAAQTTPAETPLSALPYTPGLDIQAMDRSADPCVDFYRYACGGWMKANPIPMVLARMAWQKQIAGTKLESRDGLAPDQRFFVAFAQWACENNRPENLRLQALTDPHSPARHRVNGLVVNLPEFEKAFACKPGQPMVRENRCRVW